jgi:CDP-diacylglycerol pyrophosphatase
VTLRPLLAAAFAALAALSGCAQPYPQLPPPPIHLHGQALWTIVHDKCLPHQLQQGDPAPCAQVSGPGGFAVLKDLNGVAQHLLLPTDKITGIEDARVLAPDARNYFAEAWTARRFVEARLGGPVPRDEIGVAVNSLYGRSQDLLHLHVDCLSFAVRDQLRADAPAIGPHWSRQPLVIGGHAYRVLRLDGEDLSGARPFKLLADGLPGAARDMGAWTLALVGETSPDGLPGFYLLAERADPLHGESGSSEVILDHSCKQQAAGIAAHKG